MFFVKEALRPHSDPNRKRHELVFLCKASTEVLIATQNSVWKAFWNVIGSLCWWISWVGCEEKGEIVEMFEQISGVTMDTKALKSLLLPRLVKNAERKCVSNLSLMWIKPKRSWTDGEVMEKNHGRRNRLTVSGSRCCQILHVLLGDNTTISGVWSRSLLRTRTTAQIYNKNPRMHNCMCESHNSVKNTLRKKPGFPRCTCRGDNVIAAAVLFATQRWWCDSVLHQAHCKSLECSWLDLKFRNDWMGLWESHTFQH